MFVVLVGAGFEEDVVVVEGIVGAGGAGLEFEAVFEGAGGGGGARSDVGMTESREEDAMGGCAWARTEDGVGSTRFAVDGMGSSGSGEEPDRSKRSGDEVV